MQLLKLVSGLEPLQNATSASQKRAVCTALIKQPLIISNCHSLKLAYIQKGQALLLSQS